MHQISPTVSPFTADKYSQPVKSLFPQISRDTVVSDPEPTQCFAQSSLIGKLMLMIQKIVLLKKPLIKSMMIRILV